MLVLDANVALAEVSGHDSFRRYGNEELVAPAFMWSEARSGLHEAVWRGEVPAQAGRELLGRLERVPVEARAHPQLGEESWRVADELGWAKTYDAEYIALAKLLGCRLVTLDRRLRRGADQLGFVVSPSEL